MGADCVVSWKHARGISGIYSNKQDTFPILYERCIEMVQQIVEQLGRAPDHFSIFINKRDDEFPPGD